MFILTGSYDQVGVDDFVAIGDRMFAIEQMPLSEIGDQIVAILCTGSVHLVRYVLSNHLDFSSIMAII